MNNQGENKKLEDLGWILGFLLGYSVFAGILFFIFKDESDPSHWTYLKIIPIPFLIIVLSRAAKKIFN